MNRALLSSILIALAMLTGCATTAPVGEAKYRLSDFEKPGTDAELDISDPLEPLNKSLYRFNYYFDSYFFIPLVDAYQFVIPDYAEQRIASFFDNIADIRNTFNGALQLKPASTGTSLSRFAINSTVGVFGLWDPASTWGLQRQDEDFGQTLGHYGVDNGPYLVLPVFGPSNLRDTSGLLVDGWVFSRIDPLNFEKNDLDTSYYALYAITTRKREPFRYYKSGSPFEYEFIRLLYAAKRQLQVAK
ncbi:MAG: VacJ family lipoprotein [Zoogloeaceae bacterium]|nr:VacJ family lipoprotein [Zoogloeaceae bacterium]